MTKCCKSDCRNDALGAVCVVLDGNEQATELAYCQDHMSEAALDYVLRDPRQVQFTAATYEAAL
jgi:hypothetical protein